MNLITQNIESRLFELQDKDYKDFQVKLMPGVDPDSVIGVRTPQLRALAKELYSQQDIDKFLSSVPHRYYDENNLHGFIICNFKDYRQTVDALDKFLPFVDNWATCDMLKPAAFKKKANRRFLAEDAKRWINSELVYTKRFGMEVLMTHFLDEDFSEEYPEIISKINCDEYYIMMMAAWYFATALAKQYDYVIPYIENNVLDVRTHNKAIQKATESYRITSEQKAYLRTLKRK